MAGLGRVWKSLSLRVATLLLERVVRAALAEVWEDGRWGAARGIGRFKGRLTNGSILNAVFGACSTSVVTNMWSSCTHCM
ncbi:hypothetical protein EDB89DRAFT_2018800 [Lactarius sanguifluus]|nr:hypothetical protein EDB89DRAFT_2018800 [Lactarius sanguifluus]